MEASVENFEAWLQDATMYETDDQVLSSSKVLLTAQFLTYDRFITNALVLVRLTADELDFIFPRRDANTLKISLANIADEHLSEHFFSKKKSFKFHVEHGPLAGHYKLEFPFHNAAPFLIELVRALRRLRFPHLCDRTMPCITTIRRAQAVVSSRNAVQSRRPSSAEFFREDGIGRDVPPRITFSAEYSHGPQTAKYRGPTPMPVAYLDTQTNVVHVIMEETTQEKELPKPSIQITRVYDDKDFRRCCELLARLLQM